jgi:hypothetical protein
MKFTFLIILTFFLCSNCAAQSPCGLTDVFQKVKGLDLKETGSLTFKKFSSFDFSRFLPIDNKALDQEYEVGFSATGEMREITYIGKSKFYGMYKLIVFDFKDCRILILKHLVIDKFLFTPIALVTLKSGNENYAINFVKRFGKEDACCGPFYYSEFPVTEINSISSIMLLNNDLFPMQIVQLSEMQIVISSDVLYEKDNPTKIIKESASFFLSPGYYTNLKINPSICMSELVRSCQVPPDLVIDMVPNIHGFDRTPLWLFGGAIDYKKCSQ